ncbi:MAG: methylated-DNA--[protein]-cysteine S-methyltransferase, partial [Gemmatimonadota bacterium]
REEFPLWGVEEEPEALETVVVELREYFRGDRRSFGVTPDLTGLTPFQQEVLEAISRVPFGERVTYGELARRIDRPKASRAVGNALGRNPVPIIVPCHRVVRSDGDLGGYTAGTGYKEQLLELESRS